MQHKSLGGYAALIAFAAAVACSDDGGTTTDTTTMTTGGSGGDMAGAGTTSSGGTGSAMAGTSSAGDSAGGATAGSGGEVASAGTDTAGGDAGSGGAGGAAGPTAMATMSALGHADNMNISGTAVFTDDGDMVTLTLTLADCFPGDHASHIHENPDCSTGAAAGNHWKPNQAYDDMTAIGDITCGQDGTGTLEVSRPKTDWTIGDPMQTDLTIHSIITHAQSVAEGAGERVACGVIEMQ